VAVGIHTYVCLSSNAHNCSLWLDHTAQSIELDLEAGELRSFVLGCQLNYTTFSCSESAPMESGWLPRSNRVLRSCDSGM